MRKPDFIKIRQPGVSVPARLWVIFVAAALLSLSCQPAVENPGPSASAPESSGVATETSGRTTSTAPSSSVPTPVPTPGTPPMVVLDPGHNGGNATQPAAINRQVPAGRGKTKPCNTTGTATRNGYPEHAFTFDVARRVGQALSAAGISATYTRADDDSVGPCVDRRAAIGNTAKAAAVVSIHADGSTVRGARGFHIAYADPPLNASQGEPAHRLAASLRDALASAGFPTANYLGRSGLASRDDLAGLNLAERPAVLVECGNMRNAAEAAVMESASGRQRYAAAIAAGIIGFLRA